MGLFQISSIIIFFASLGFGLFVYRNDPGSKLNRSWLYFSVSVGIWGLSLYGVTSAQNPSSALSWQYVLDGSALFIPVFYLYFISAMLSFKNRWVKIFPFIIALILSVLSLTPFFKTGMVMRFGFFWVEPGPLYFLFPTFFILCVLYSVFLLIREYVKQKGNGIIRSQIKYQTIAGIIGFSGGITNFLPQIFNIYPFGNYFISLYIFFVSYSILRYKLFNVKTVAAELFAGGVVILFLFNLLGSVTPEEWLINLLLFVLVLSFSILIVRGVFKEIANRERIQKLAKDLEKANDRLRELDQQKSEFVSIASHQLRSPLTAIKGYSSMLLEGSFGSVPEKARGAVNRVLKSSEHLVTLVEDLLNISRIEQGRMEYTFTATDLGKMAKDIMEALMPNAEKNKLKLSFTTDESGPYTVVADQEKLRQVVLNLIDNSIKYTPKGFVKVHVGRDAGRKTIVLSVADSGVGVTPELKDRLFEKFSRGDEKTKLHVNGTGLGLYVAREMLKAHKGNVWVESPGEGKGSTFFIELPSA
ncbi:MAG: ATP-binding protein [Patescibacteria group bacterium]